MLEEEFMAYYIVICLIFSAYLELEGDGKWDS